MLSLGDGIDIGVYPAPETRRAGGDSTRTFELNRCHELWIVQSPDRAAASRRFSLPPQGTLVVGRSASLEGRVLDHRLSKEHFAITSAGRGYQCVDLGSTNGTFVDGVPCRTSACAPGSVIRAGDSLFVLTQAKWNEVEVRARCFAASFVPILLQGATGTGKEVLARLIHDHSGRTGAFVAVNCAAVSKELMLAEFFGHARGAFSGASGIRNGLFRAADRGTLLLDEIGDLPLELQPILLRVLETQRVRPLGSDAEIPVDVRIVSATNVDLVAAVEAGRFRSDLYARVAKLALALPALCDHREDIVRLAREFAQGAALTATAAEALLLWDWPLNVRQLRGAMQVAVALAADRSLLHLADVSAQDERIAARLEQRRATKHAEAGEASPSSPLAARRAEMRLLLQQHGGNVTRVAQALGKPRAQVYRWARALGLDTAAFRRSD